MAECDIETDFGSFRLVTYLDRLTDQVHHALVKGEPTAEQDVLVRVHLMDPLRDVLAVHLMDGSRPLRSALERIAREPVGVIVVLSQDDDPRALVRRVRALALEPDGAATTQAGAQESRELRTYGIGAQILFDLGVRRMRVLSAPRKLHAISGFGLDVVEYVS
jgi:3,4-dihydroxy 2-butanone 4-phosphate synthase/GTP cyclohydrolase II